MGRLKKPKLIPEVNYKKFPILFQLDKKVINRILDDTLGITKCIKCKTKIMRTECTSVEQKERGWCTRCWQRQYGRTHKLGKRKRQFVSYNYAWKTNYDT